jgi:hypothetical protein
MMWDTRLDLVACFAWKQVGLGFPSFASKLVKEQRWVVHVTTSWRLCEGEADAVHVGLKYPSLAVISFSPRRRILVFCLDL